MQIGYHEPDPPPLHDYLLSVYFRIFLESFEEKSLKNLEIFKKKSSHYHVMVYIKNLHNLHNIQIIFKYFLLI